MRETTPTQISLMAGHLAEFLRQRMNLNLITQAQTLAGQSPRRTIALVDHEGGKSSSPDPFTISVTKDRVVVIGLTLVGGGALHLSAANLCAGPTLISEGTLWLSGSTSNHAPVIVTNAAALQLAGGIITVSAVHVLTNRASNDPGSTQSG